MNQAQQQWIDSLKNDVEIKFKVLSFILHDKYRFSSNHGDWYQSSHYMAIIGLGPLVVPYLIEDLKKDGAPWYAALRAITGHQVEIDNPGNIKELNQKWISWWEEKS